MDKLLRLKDLIPQHTKRKFYLCTGYSTNKLSHSKYIIVYVPVPYCICKVISIWFIYEISYNMLSYPEEEGKRLSTGRRYEMISLCLVIRS